MQDLGAESAHWRALAEQAGPGWRVWRWEEVEGDTILWRFRLLAPGEKPEGLGYIIPL